MTLKEYRRKRDFKKTAEPKGGTTKKGWLYIIQKHDASHLHYDFRLQLGDVLLSWAVPKGPSLDPSTKRLAMHVEDHPVEYGSFEGTIPEGEYGGGTVMLWDRGHWEPAGEAEDGGEKAARKAYEQGRLKFHLFGEKLHGGWMLVRKGGGKDRDERAWFLFKERDDEARDADDYDITTDQPLSVKTGRDLDDIATRSKNVWHSNKEEKKASTAKSKATKSTATKKATKAAKKKTAVATSTTRPKARTKRKASKRGRSPKADDVSGARRGRLPKFIKPQLATLTDEPPEGTEWLHEMKFDGYRMLCRIDNDNGDEGDVKFISRNEQDWTSKFSPLVAEGKKLPVTTALLDGEVVIVQPDGTTSFQALQQYFKNGGSQPLVYYVFDLLHINGWDVTGATLDDRKRLLEQLVPNRDAGAIRLSDHIEGSGADMFAAACKAHLEGIICKRRDRPYSAGRGYDWLKVKCVRRDEFVIGGYTPPSGARTGFGALLLGYHNRGGELLYAGKVGTGFDDRTLRDLYARLTRLERKTSPFANLKGTTGEARHAHWVEPKLVGQIEFTEWTSDRRLRHPSFQGLREDKPAAKVVRDEAVPVEKAVEKSDKKVKA